MNKQDFSSLTFLVIDDDGTARKTVIEYLMSFGCEKIFEAKDGRDALIKLQGAPIDFIISDWEMPDPNGLDLLKLLRSNEKLEKTPFVMVTSPISHEKMKIQEAADAKVDAYLIKPFRARILREKIVQILEDRAQDLKTGIVVSDDDADVRGTIVEILHQMGHAPVYEAENGEEGFKLLKEHADKIALVVSDWEMPKLSGIEFLRKVRIDRELSHTPFLMVTSQTEVEAQKVQKAIEAKVDHYLMKPFKVADFKAKVEYILAKVKQNREIERGIVNGESALIEGNWPDAERCFREVLAVDPKNVDAYLGRAQIHLSQTPVMGYEEGIELIKTAIRLNPFADRAHVKLALVFESAMSLEKAISYLRQALEACPNSALIYYHLGRLLVRRGRVEDGIVFLKKAVEVDPNMKDARDILGME